MGVDGMAGGDNGGVALGEDHWKIGLLVSVRAIVSALVELRGVGDVYIGPTLVPESIFKRKAKMTVLANAAIFKG